MTHPSLTSSAHNPTGIGSTRPLFETVLIANRGEIACRIIRTLRSLGIQSVAVYSDADSHARHVQEADRAVRIGPASVTESYLNIGAVIRACRESGVDAVHPGYGFLSENVDFARELQAAGIAFIGPGVESLNVMGDKIRSKNHVAGYGVPVVPGIAQPGMTDGQLIDEAAAVGFPLLIKPSAGGGGKGMHVVEDPADLPATLATARRVAASAFGDDTLFLERLVRTPRHIEVQILADNHGNVIHLGERECSLQRRHQKVIEEAPSPLLEGLHDGEAVRARIGEAACQAARSVDYSGAGTVEFIVSNDAPDEFFFMEMNTRLQVEHPVTEMVTGVDLVEWQVRIAAGEELTLSQSDVELKGHAVEARIYAENPEQNFLPSTGTVQLLHEPATWTAAGAEAKGEVRIDSALLPGLEISPHYDPMISKVVAWGEDRESALNTLDDALSGYRLLGVETNVEYLRLLINDAEVRAGKLDTELIERKMPGFSFRAAADGEFVATALYLLAMDAGRPASEADVWTQPTGWRLGKHAPLRISLSASSGEVRTVSVTHGDCTGSEFEVSVDNGPPHTATLSQLGDDAILLRHNGEVRKYSIATITNSSYQQQVINYPTALYLGEHGWACRMDILTRQARLDWMLGRIQRAEGTVDPEVRSPMPGTVVSVTVSTGEEVVAGQVLLSVEAMKMEHQLLAPQDGTVQINAHTGALVRANQILATVRGPQAVDS
jgi:acetyl-CoA/propionyl-CoA carboxylase biotin carboxyl carrier protein